MSARRVLVATEGRCPRVALEHATAFAGEGGEVVLASVLVVPLAQPLDASLDRAVADACAVLDDAERRVPAGVVFDTRLLRGRSFAEAVLDAMLAERFDVLVLQVGRGGLRDGSRAQVDVLMERVDATVVLVRPREEALSP